MGTDSGIFSAGAEQRSPQAFTDKRRVVFGKQRLQMTGAAARLPTVFDSAYILPQGAIERTLGEGSSRDCGKDARRFRKERQPELWPHRLAKRENGLCQ